MTFSPLPGQTCLDVLESARDDQRKSRWAEALEKFAWFFENSRGQLGMGGVRLSFALADWLDLAAVYPPAKVALVALRDKTENDCRISGGNFDSFHELSALNRVLDANERTTAMFLELAESNPAGAENIYHVVEPLLIEQGLFEACAPFLDVDKTLDVALRMMRMAREQVQLRLDTGKDMELEHVLQFQGGKIFRESALNLVRLLAINGRREEAEDVVRRALAELDTAEFRANLQRALGK